MQPDIANGGRANTISVHPTNNSSLLVASESGGLFRSTNGGTTWSHIDGLAAFWTNAVAYVPADPNIVIATTLKDFRTVNGGGIWRSTNGGTTWTQAAGAPAPAGVTERLSAYEISIAPDNGTIYVGTQYGVSYSSDRGVTWLHTDPFGAADHRVNSVVALPNGLVIVGGPNGIRRSTDGGLTWRASASGAGGPIYDMHALTRSPYWIDQAYVVNGNTELYYTEDGGDHWTRIMGAPSGGGGCGGIAFVKAIPQQRVPPAPIPPNRGVLLWFGNRCGLSTLICWETSARTFNYFGTWFNTRMDHGDTRDLAFDNNNQAILLGTDGGLHKTTNGGNDWTLAGGGHNGYNALQVTEVKGQAIAGLNRHDLYFATQDNNLWASGDGGRNWVNPVCCEGFFIEAERRVPQAADSKVSFVACGSCVDLAADPLFTNVNGWRDAQTPPNGNPKIIGRSQHIQGVSRDTVFTKGFAYSANLGASWAQYASFPEDRLDLPKLARTWLVPVLYQPIRISMTSSGRNVDKLVRITGSRFFPTGSVSYPLMNNFGGLGINPTMFAWYEVFAVDPFDSRHLIAPDLLNEKMMETHDGGDNWTEIPALTQLVTDNGRFLFGWSMFPHASAISFNPDNPNLVAVGTWQGGILLSRDRGATWSRITGSERVTDITSIEWKSATEAVVSSYGRGLWRLASRFILPFPQFDTYCKTPCTIQPFTPVVSQSATRAILAFNGRILGGTATNGVLQELFVTPASSVVIFSDTSDLTAVKITEADKESGFKGATAPAGPAKQSMAAVTLGKNGNLLGAAFTANPLPMYEPTDKEKTQDNDPVGGTPQSPTLGKPYAELDVAGAALTKTVAPKAPLHLTGRSFPRAASLTITVDDVTALKLKSGDLGDFTATVTAPTDPGLHSVKVLDANGKLLDGAMFLVGHADEEEDD
jgi:photosystem II stability/assembly factor-like uncharacterized protein